MSSIYLIYLIKRRCLATAAAFTGTGKVDGLAGRRFFESTRGRIIGLRSSGRAVEGLRHEPGLTNDGVWARLAALERDGLVWLHRACCAAAAAGKPAYVYELMPDKPIPEGLRTRASPTLGGIGGVARTREIGGAAYVGRVS
jgi:hypothetical protein